MKNRGTFGAKDEIAFISGDRLGLLRTPMTYEIFAFLTQNARIDFEISKFDSGEMDLTAHKRIDHFHRAVMYFEPVTPEEKDAELHGNAVKSISCHDIQVLMLEFIARIPEEDWQWLVGQ